MDRMDKEELLKEIDKRLKQLRKEFIARLDDKKEFKLTYPEDEEVIYLADCEVTSVLYDAVDKADKLIFEHGLYFNTEQEAEQHLKERRLLFKLHQWAKFKNNGWAPDWANLEQQKYYIFYDHYRKELCISYGYSTRTIDKLSYFKSEEIAKECIELFGDEIIEVLC